MNTCGCSVGYEDCERATVWHERRVGRSRAPHQCCECEREIPTGSRCCMATWLYEGEWETVYRCLSCSTLAEYVATATGACPLWRGLWDSCDSAEISFRDWQARWDGGAPGGTP